MEEKNYALVTGASSGIGLELIKLLAADKYNLVLVARSEEKLNELAGELKLKYNINVIVIAKDLSQIDAAKEIFNHLSKENITVDILINNAGFGGKGVFAETNLDYELSMMQVNMGVLVELTKYFLPRLLSRKHGKIMNVASTAAFASGPFMAVYYATKAFVLSFTEAVANEVKGTGITVTALCPGPTNTGFQKQAGVENTNLFASNVMSAASVARTGYKAMNKGKTIVIAGLSNKLLIFSIRFSPRNAVILITRWFQKNRK